MAINMNFGPSPSGEAGFNWEDAFRKLQAQRIANQRSIAGTPGKLDQRTMLENNRSQTTINNGAQHIPALKNTLTNALPQHTQMEQNRGATPIAQKNQPAPPSTRGSNFQGGAAFRGGLPAEDNWAKGRGFTGQYAQELASDPGLYNYEWSKTKGYGQMAEDMLGRWMDPESWYYLTHGGNAPIGDDMNRFRGQINSTAFQKAGGANGLQSAFSARDAASMIFSAKPGDQSELGDMLYAAGQGGASPEAQVANTIEFLGRSLAPLMSKEVLDAYLYSVQREGYAWASKLGSTTGATSGTFGQHMQGKFGASGGL